MTERPPLRGSWAYRTQVSPSAAKVQRSSYSALPRNFGLPVCTMDVPGGFTVVTVSFPQCSSTLSSDQLFDSR